MRIDWIGFSDFDEYFSFRYPADVDDLEKKEKMRRELWWRFNPPASVDNDPVIAVRDDDSKLIGQFVGLPTRLWVEGKTVTSCWSVDMWTVPEARGKGVMSTIIKNLGEKYPFMIAPGSNPIAQRRFSPPAFEHISDFYRYIGVINAGAFIKYFQPKAPALALARPFAFLVPKARKLPTPEGVEVRRIDSFDQEFDGLWERLRGNFSVIAERTADWLKWRFDSCPFRTYHRFAVYEKGTLAGYLVMRWFKQGGAMRGFITDIFTDFKHPALTRALLNAAYDAAKENGVDFITIIASGKALEPRLKESRFFRIPFESFDTIRNNTDEPEIAKIITAKENWFLTQADSDYDLNIIGLSEEKLFLAK